MTSSDERPPDHNAPRPTYFEVAPHLHTSELFIGRQEVLIEHRGAIYRLRITRSGKLILQK